MTCTIFHRTSYEALIFGRPLTWTAVKLEMFNAVCATVSCKPVLTMITAHSAHCTQHTDTAQYTHYDTL